ncbi:hypothetical protein THOE12_60162 [Vibrio rotiferianus]|nr:hypothetical protein THOE12_60162 [Vibrio rotiferianus]
MVRWMIISITNNKIIRVNSKTLLHIGNNFLSLINRYSLEKAVRGYSYSLPHTQNIAFALTAST